MTEETKRLVFDLLKIGLVGTVIGIPLGVWAMKRWPDESWKTALLLTGVGFGVKEFMLHRRTDVADAEAASQMGQVYVQNEGYTMPAPARGSGVYWSGKVHRGDGAVFRRGLSPTVT